MRRKMNWVIAVIYCLALAILLIGCNSRGENNDNSEATMKYYTKEDFLSITMGKSSYQDVYKIAPVESMQITSYGGFVVYPMANDRYIRIKFYGSDLIVGDIEEVSMPIEEN